MIAVFGGGSGVVPSPLPAALAHQFEGADALVVLDPLAFPFESLPFESGPLPLVLRFDTDITDTPAEIWEQLGEVVLSKLTADEVVVAPDDVIDMLRSEPQFGASTGRVSSISADGAVELAAMIDAAQVARHRTVRQLAATLISAAVAEVPSGRQPELAWVDGGAGFLSSELAATSVSAEHQAIDIALVSFALSGQSAKEQRATVEALWEFLRPGGSFIVIDSLNEVEMTPPLSVDSFLEVVAVASDRQAVLADVTTIEHHSMSAVGIRLQKLGGFAAAEPVREPRNKQPVFILANDVVPGLGMPTAAPGLRAAGLRAGLRANHIDTTLVTPVGNRPSPWRSAIPAPAHADTAVVRPVDLRTFLTNRAPATVVITTSNFFDLVNGIDGIDVVFDLFAPKVLELACSVPPASEDAIDRLRERKVQALAGASAYVVNGEKKRPYLQGWLSDAGVDPDTARIVGTKMAIQGTESTAPAVSSGGPLRLATTGYVQRWSQPGTWLEAVTSKLSNDMVLSTVLATHWGERAQVSSPAFELFDANPWVRNVPPMEFEAFAAFLASQHVVIDLFHPTAERELAMVTRTVVALASGTPVIHPPFTEVSPLIAEYDAGWLVDPADPAELGALLDHLTANRRDVEDRAANARKLWADHFEPKVAATEMADLLCELEQSRPAR